VTGEQPRSQVIEYWNEKSSEAIASAQAELVDIIGGGTSPSSGSSAMARELFQASNSLLGTPDCRMID
jgi:hypothetical protein